MTDTQTNRQTEKVILYLGTLVSLLAIRLELMVWRDAMSSSGQFPQ